MNLKRVVLSTLIVSALSFSGITYSAGEYANTQQATADAPTHQQMIEWYRDAKFGMFIHLGIYSGIGKGEWSLQTRSEFNNGKLSGLNSYNSHIDELTITKENIARLVSRARSTGMQYIILTSRHHDSFSLWDTQADKYSSQYNAVAQGPKFDILKAFADESHKQGIKLFVYYSLLDWTRSDYPVTSSPSQAHLRVYQNQEGNWRSYRAFMNRQLSEILTNYGSIAGIWFDGYWAQDDKSLWQIESLYDTINKLQPAALIGNNHGIDASTLLSREDFSIGERGAAAGDSDIPGETVDTSQIGSRTGSSSTWGYVEGADIRSSAWMIKQLITSISAGKNFVLNVGPRGDGTYPDALANALTAVGAWTTKNAEAIYSTRAGLPGTLSTRRSDADGNTYFYFFVENNGSRYLTISSPEYALRSAAVLGSGVDLPLNNTGDGATVDLKDITFTDGLPAVIKIAASK